MSLSLLTSCIAAQPALAGHVLGGAWIASDLPPDRMAWPQQCLRTPVLGPQSLVQERWVLQTALPLHAGKSEGIAWRLSLIHI